MLMIQFINFI